MTDLEMRVQYLKGVGEARAQKLEKLGVLTLGDLLTFFPRAYEDRTVFCGIGDFPPGELRCIRAMVASEPVLAGIRQGFTRVSLRISDGRDTMPVTFFNMPYVRSMLTPGETFVFCGRNTGTADGPAMVNPLFEREGEDKVTGRLVAVYPLTAGLSQRTVAQAVRAALSLCGESLPAALPEEIRTRYSLAQTRFAYEQIHIPRDAGTLELARRRLIFEELFLFSCGLSLLREKRDRGATAAMPLGDLTEFCASLPFPLTGAQSRAMETAAQELCSPVPMARLVQGDVGSGKTVVAAALLWLCAKNGRQAAFMAPTEILAEQHFHTLTGFLSPLGVRIGLLTGSMGARERRQALQAAAQGETDVLVGTHALLSRGVIFRDLALAVTDEQHRFGVLQRAALASKGEGVNVLVLSATPIPRTLALILYGDLDVSIIDELPPGRQKVDTFAVEEEMRPRIQRFILRLVGEGRQVFIICPRVEDEDGSEDVKSVEEYTAKLRQEIFPQLRIDYLHGKRKPKEKESVMAAFAAGETDILVSTTVVEVGVDVPNAALMVVENAERFGLSQLHQLRGRVGRGPHKSYCVLFRGGGGDTAAERLKVLCATNDGFRIAEEDLRLRGPGDFFGSRQSGLPELRLASFAADAGLLRDAHEAAQTLLREDPTLTAPGHEALAARVAEMLQKNADTTS